MDMRGIGLRTLALGSALVAGAASAQTTFSIEGGYVFGTDYLYLDPPPDFPGTLNFGNGPYAGAMLEFGDPDLFGRISVGGFVTNGSGGATRDVTIFTTTYNVVETEELRSRFFWADIAGGTTVGSGVFALAVSGGIRLLDVRHDDDSMTVTTPVIIGDGTITGEDRVSFFGAGPSLGAQATIGSGPVRFFAGGSAAILFGGTTLERTLTFGGFLPPATDSYQAATTAYAVDGQAGITIGSPTVALSLGYRASAFWNTDNGRAAYDLYPATSNVAVQQGPFARFSVTY